MASGFRKRNVDEIISQCEEARERCLWYKEAEKAATLTRFIRRVKLRELDHEKGRESFTIEAFVQKDLTSSSAEDRDVMGTLTPSRRRRRRSTSTRAPKFGSTQASSQPKKVQKKKRRPRTLSFSAPQDISPYATLNSPNLRNRYVRAMKLRGGRMPPPGPKLGEAREGFFFPPSGDKHPPWSDAERLQRLEPEWPMVQSQTTRDDLGVRFQGTKLFRQRLQGGSLVGVAGKTRTSAYSDRRLKPFIRREVLLFDPSIKKPTAEHLRRYPHRRAPLRVRMHRELLATAEVVQSEGHRHPEVSKFSDDMSGDQFLDFFYLHPRHVMRINRFLTGFFWPDIDVRNNLVAPEYSIVAMYKELVVGCGFVTPEGYITFLAVHPGWQQARIASFMLYHLIQMCPRKDITLHVSVTNSAMFLYQAFGFKTEEVINNFYSQFYREDGRKTTALFMRLRR